MKAGHMIPDKMEYRTILILVILVFTVSRSPAQDKNHQHHVMQDTTLTERQEMIHQHGPMVMPFDMNKVTHYFIKNKNGGNLIIKTKNKNDTVQAALVRKHLKKEQLLFSKGDFRDPKTLHGKNMPGLKILSQSAGRFTVGYKQLMNGARLKFTSKDPVVIDAIHEWFDAQLKDHGSDAKSRE